MMYADVIIEYGNKAVDTLFTYIIPDNLREKIKIGHRVLVPFNNREIEGFVLDISNEFNSKYELKEISSLCDLEPVLNEEMIILGEKIQKEILCSRISIYQAMLPKALKAKHNTNIGIKMNRYITLNISRDEALRYIEGCRFAKQKEIISKLLDSDKILLSNVNSSINTLIRNGVIKYIYEEVNRYVSKSSGKYRIVKLNSLQEEVVNSVKLEEYNKYLLWGVTGSGKTEVYMELIDRVLKQGKNAIMLVPEISLTPQIVDRFVTRFGTDIAILHSGLSDYEKYDEYRKIINEKVRIVVGARSAVFAPLKNIGIIIMDEEHSNTYKQDNSPRYHARDVAMMRGEYHNAPVLLGSATPSLESFARAGRGVYKLLTLTKRAGGGELPDVQIVDMKSEIKKGNFILSELLVKKIKEKLANNEQIILLLNRRGYSSMLTCRDCGNVLKCPNCDISLTYHKSSNTNRCHYCNYSIKNVDKCNVCGSSNIKEYGLGTEKLEEEIVRMFSARVVRMDMDTTCKKGMHEKIIADFGNHKYDILLGTQMIAKGLDFPLVTLVGVINADSSLNVPDFRSAENTYQLLSQVAGRAGRGNLVGEVIIQSYNPEHYSITYAKKHDYLSFYKEEMSIRKLLNYPPYYYITLVNISSRNYEDGFKEANKIGEYLKRNLDKNTIVLGPSMANVFRINNVYHYQCIIKYKKDLLLNQVLTKLDEIYKSNTKVQILLDVNPVRM
ncbi:MAG: primosomal protein N' [Erysipelotrichaceae bacterium]|nr:primosomal protein N' [Erysipelotrichaceae bacterium]